MDETFTFEDPSTQVTFEDPVEAKPLPPPPVLQARAEKAAYAMGADGTGPLNIQQTLLGGEEGSLRKAAAGKMDAQDLSARQQMLVEAAQQRGGDISYDHAVLLKEMSQLSTRHDPLTSLEQLYANRFVSDVYTTSEKAARPDAAGSVAEEGDVAAGAMASKEFYQTQYEDLLAKQQKQGWFRYLADYAVGMVPFLSWYRQAAALQERPFHIENVLPGKTMADNVKYMWALPLSEQKRAYKTAMTKLDADGNVLDQMMFTQALISFSTSDEYLASAMGIADYATVLSPLVRALMPAKAAVTGRALVPYKPGEMVPVSRPDRPFQPSGLLTDQRSLEARSESNRFINQPDMFGEPPAQGSFRFMQGAEQTAPPFGSGLPPGRIRATHTTEFGTYQGEGGPFQLPAGTREVPPSGLFRDSAGKVRRSTESFTQGDLPFSARPHQTELPLEAPRKPVQGFSEAPGSNTSAEIKSIAVEAVKATEGRLRPDPEEVVAAIGEVGQSSYLGALKRLLNPLGIGNKEVLKELPTAVNPLGWYRDSQLIGRDRAQRLAPRLQQAIDRLYTTTAGLARPSRLTPDQLALARATAERDFRMDYAGQIRGNDLVVDFMHLPPEKHPSRVYTSVMKLGMPDGSLFPSPEKAALFRDQLGFSKEQAQIYRQGGHYFLGIAKHLDEVTDAVRDGVLTNGNTTNKGMINNLLSRLRSTDDLLSMLQRGNRKVATHAPQELRKAMRDFISENITSLPKASRRRVEDMLRINRDTPNPLNPAERGVWYNSAGEFERAFVARHGIQPTEAEVVAYDQYKRLSDFDWLVRNVTLYRDKARQGIQNFRFYFLDGDGVKQSSPMFEGKKLREFPWQLGKADHDAGIWVYDSTTGKGTFHYKFDLDPHDPRRKELNDLIEKKGYSVIQIADPKTHPLEGIAKRADGQDLADRVHFVITNTHESSPLSFKQVDYRPGGHVIYSHPWYVAQAQVQAGRLGKRTYLGDNVALNVRTEAEARQWSQALDKGRILYRDGKWDELNDYIDKSLPHTRDQFYDLFRRSDSPFDPHLEISFKQEGHTTFEKTKSSFPNIIDATKDPYDLSNSIDKSFLMDRDRILSGVLEKNGELRLVDAEQLDPYIALNRALGQNLRNVWMNEYKIGAVEQWIREFQHVMDVPLKTLGTYPIHFLYKPQWGNVSSDALGDLKAAQAAQRAIVNFIGTNTEVGETMGWLKTKLLNGIYNQVGQGMALDTAMAVTSDPVQFLRGFAFHSKLGFFNPVQFFVQAQSMFHSIAVAGVKHGIPGFTAAPLIRALGHNPDMLDTVAGVASKLGWSKEQFKEMYATLNKTGLYQVAGEAAMRDDVFDPHLFRSTLGYYVLEAGPMFFNEGERMTRLTAFATAFREFRAVNQTVKLGDREIGQIMRRADDLSVNMTRSSNAAWQTGAISIPTQFFAYNARVMEQLLGGRLTGAEKARVLATYSTLYGLPIGLGAAVGGVFPGYDSIKQEAFKRGINLNEGVLKVLTEGVLAQMGSWVTGKDYNVAQRYGPGNQQAIFDALHGDKTLPDILGGASGSVLSDAVKAMAPFYYHLAAGGKEYPVQAEDWLTLARNISTFDMLSKQYAILAYGKWQTKSGTVVANTQGVDALAAAMGLSPREVSDTFLWQKSLRAQAKTKDSYEQLAMEQYRYGLQQGAVGNYTAMRDFFTRAETAKEMGDLTYKERGDVYRRAIKQNKDLADKVKWDAYNKAHSHRQDILDNFIRK